MKHFTKIDDLNNFDEIIESIKHIKKNPFVFEKEGKRKILGLIFFNPSLRTRLSTQKAAKNLGLETIVMNFSNEAWAIEYEDNIIMQGDRSEHIREAATVISQYCDMVAIRAFASLTNKEQDENEIVIESFKKYASIPVINMESATAHPLQALADAITIQENLPEHRPKIVLSWAPHPKALPHAVANSFLNMSRHLDADISITHPKGYELNPEITKGIPINYNQNEVLENADFVYVKNWCSYQSYGEILRTDHEWTMTKEKMEHTNNAKFMHCLPIRRNIVAMDDVLDHPSSLVIEQANNRTYAAQAILKTLLNNG